MTKNNLADEKKEIQTWSEFPIDSNVMMKQENVKARKGSFSQEDEISVRKINKFIGSDL